MYLASMKWPTGTEPICVGEDKNVTIKKAVEILREQHGTGDVIRPYGMCAKKITRSGIEIDCVQKV